MGSWRRAAAVAAISTLVGGVLTLFPRPTTERRAAPEPVCTWLAGDLDVHTAYTFVSARGRLLDEALTYSPSVQEQADLASERGLDFLAITDYDDVSAQSDPSYGSNGLIWIPAYEHPFAGVAQMLGLSQTIPVGASSVGEVRRTLRSMRAEGGVFQVGNPGDRRWPRAYGTDISPDALEVWFAGPWSYDPGEIGKDQTLSIGFYDRLLDAGHQVAATGGSNSLFRGISKLAGAGQPTTWVCAKDPNVAGILEAIRDGRTTLAHEFPTQASLTEGEAGGGSAPEPAQGSDSSDQPFATAPPVTVIPFLTMEADADGDGEFESLLGDAVPQGASIRVGVFGGPFSVLRLVSNNSVVVDQIDVFTPSFVHELEMPEGSTWIRAELFARPEDTVGGPCDVSSKKASYCDDRIGMLALTSPLYAGDPSEDP